MSLEIPGWEKVVLGRRDGGKLTDSQDNFLFFYRKIDPRSENFVLSATFTLLKTSGATFQSGYGIMAVDTVKNIPIESRHRNHALAGRFRTVYGANFGQGLRIVGGYTDSLARLKGGRRRLDPSRLFPTQTDSDNLTPGDSRRYTLSKTDKGLQSTLETPSGPETISFPGCDFLLRQDHRAIYVGFAIAGDIELTVTDISFEITPGRLSHTPGCAIRHCIPDYPFNRLLLPEPRSGVGKRRATYHVSPEESLEDTIMQAAPGSEIILADGIYPGSFYIPKSCSGKRCLPVTLRAEHQGKAVIDGSEAAHKLPALILRARFWRLEGLVFRNAPSCGLFVCGSDNVVSNCEASGNGDTGILLCSFPGVRKGDWPARNRVEGCLSHDNCDKVHCNADGFGAKLSVGRGNSFRSCKAFHNADDGFDLYTKSTLGCIGPVSIVDCEASFNGWLSVEEKPSAPANGAGFKLGGEGLKVRHRLSGCVSCGNAGTGFFANTNTSVVLRSCRARDNSPDFVQCASK